MPYEIRKQDGKFCVFKKGGGDALGCHDTRKGAIDQIAAVTIAERKRSRMSAFALDAESWEEDGFIYRSGKLFEAGDYADKEFAITAEELAASVAGFEGCDLGLEHVPTVLSGKLGRLETAQADGAELFGVVAIPKWLDALLGDGERKVSVAIDRETKKLCGLDLVLRPRVTDAALMAAFTAQSAPDGGGGESRMPTLWDQFKRALGAVEVPEDGSPPSAEGPVGSHDDTARFAALEAELKAEREARERLEAEHAAAWSAQVAREALAFADAQVRAGRCLPAEKPALVALFCQAAEDDRRAPSTITFGEGREGSRLDALRASYEARQPHDLLRELVKVGAPAGTVALSADPAPDPNAPMTDARRRQLLGASTLGQAVLNGEKER